MTEYELYTLPNGIRIAHKQITHSKVVHCGFILDIGSRDEKPAQHGIAHFWEHMAFKGTKKRKAFHIINRLDSVGGELNAYTTKEKICFYASVLDRHFDNAFELLTDITFDSVFPEKQIERERNVILEEMSMYYDSPEDAIQDDFDEVVFGKHPLGMNILGTSESIRRFHREDFKNFVQENLDTGKLVFSCVGNLPMKKVIRLAEKYLKDIPAQHSNRKRKSFNKYVPKQVKVERTLTQAQCAIGRDAYPVQHHDSLTFFMLTNLLGGPSMNTRLNMALREKHGLVYAVDAEYQSYTDTGMFSIYFGTEPRQLEKATAYVMKELKRLREVPLGSMQLHRTKEQLMGQLAMNSENNQSLMLAMARSILDDYEMEPLERLYEKIGATDAKKIQAVAREMLQEKDLSVLSFVPKAG
ncbi:putative Zn-dependent peptidase [Catalinimonas alkaloidigena]|uniref:M16 family metallopeptidase n=1 Tax=Catalinimonas alkaloidigena TaxID=1075417 RepID=UPI0024072B71|nr:pitrilysin family protein [Catalinimonas alkaloidigena]MDF9800124.1 putative Zn-dependent peptidase [Catalinimonas alkaloidigena]